MFASKEQKQVIDDALTLIGAPGQPGTFEGRASEALAFLKELENTSIGKLNFHDAVQSGAASELIKLRQSNRAAYDEVIRGQYSDVASLNQAIRNAAPNPANAPTTPQQPAPPAPVVPAPVTAPTTPAATSEPVAASKPDETDIFGIVKQILAGSVSSISNVPGGLLPGLQKGLGDFVSQLFDPNGQLQRTANSLGFGEVASAIGGALKSGLNSGPGSSAGGGPS